MTRKAVMTPGRTRSLSVLVVLAVAAALLVAFSPAAFAAVPFVDRLGCGTTLATRSPVFEFAGGGPAAVGAYPTTTSVSGYPPVTASYTAAAGGQATTTFDPSAYGTVFGSSGAFGLLSVSPGKTFTLRVTIPRAQRVQLTIGGLDQSSAMLVSGTSLTGGAVTPSFAERGTAPGRARGQLLGNAVRVSGATTGGVDEIPDKAVDVWFATPVATLVFQGAPAGAILDGGYLVTPPLGCQPATLSATAAAPTLVSTDPATGDLTYDASVDVTATNTALPQDMGLASWVSSTLRSSLVAAGATVQSISTSVSGSGAAHCVGTVDGALAPAGLMDPGQVCVASETARVVVPQSQTPRTATGSWSWSSSASPAARTKATASASITFPGVRSTTTLSTSGPVEVLPDHAVESALTVGNSGPGTLLGGQLVARLPPGLTLSTVPSGCSAAGDTLTCPLAAVPPGGSVQIPLSLVVAPSVAPGTTLSVSAQVGSSSEPAPVTADLAIQVVPLDPPTLSGPTAPSSSRRPEVTGSGRLGSTVTVSSPTTTVCQASVASDGTFGCTPDADLPYGATTLTATQQDGSVTSLGSAPLSVTVLEPEIVVPPVPTPSPPPSPPPSPGPTPSPGPSPRPSPSPSPSPSPRPTPSPSSSPAPSPTESPVPTLPSEPERPVAPPATGGAGGDPNDFFPTSLTLASGVLVPGQVASMVGTLGPNASDESITVTVSGTVNRGFIYRSVDSDPAGECQVSTTTFTCTITLPPGARAVLQVRLLADALNAPAYARQQLAVSTSDSAVPNVSTQTTPVKGPTQVGLLSAAITSTPGSFVILLALLLFALAATETEKRVRRAP